jgi:hypothetical protein
MDEKLQKIIALVKNSALDETIKNILIRDLSQEGLNDFLKEQIKAYCLAEIQNIDKEIEEVKKILEDHKDPNPA